MIKIKHSKVVQVLILGHFKNVQFSELLNLKVFKQEKKCVLTITVTVSLSVSKCCDCNFFDDYSLFWITMKQKTIKR